MPKVKSGIALAAALAACSMLRMAAASPPSLRASTVEALDAFLRKAADDGLVPAVAAVVVNPERVLYLQSAGKRDVKAGAALAPDAIFRIASMTKPITSAVVMMLHEEGRLGFDDPVSKYLPEFAGVRVMTAFNDADRTFDSRPPARPITVRHLLTHTSGIAYAFADARLATLDTNGKSEAEVPLLHDPGDHFTYGPNTAVLGRIVERITGTRLDAVLKTRVFDPLGMDDTFYVVPEGKRDRVVTQHVRTGGALQEQPNPAVLQSGVRGDGGLFSTAGDYARFMRLFLNGGRAGARRLLAEASVRQMMSNQIGRLFVEEQPSANPPLAKPFPFGGGKDRFGFGFQIEGMPPAPGLRSAGSASWGGIDNTHFWIDPQKRIAAAVLMQFLPYYDLAALDVLRGVERIVYAPN